MSSYPIQIGEEGTEQFTAATYLNGELIHFERIHHPFASIGVRISGWGRLKAIFCGLTVEVVIRGSEGAQRAILALNPMVLEFETRQILDEQRRSRETAHREMTGVQSHTNGKTQ